MYQPVIFGRNAQTKSMCRPECRRNGIQIIQRVNVDPGPRHSNDQIGMAETQFLDRFDQLFPQRELFMHQIGARHTQMNAPRRQFTRNFTCRQQDQADTLNALDGTGILSI